jgi:hypothetical protein
MKTENDDQLRQELRLAQLEIKILREQLLKAVQEAQQTQDEVQQPAECAAPQPPDWNVAVPMV